MTQPVKWEQYPQQKIIDRYEELRASILREKQSSPKNHLGHSILLFRGMAVWIEACLAGEEFDVSHKELSHGQPTHSATSNDCWQLDKLCESIHVEATRILTNMVMNHQKVRGCNV